MDNITDWCGASLQELYHAALEKKMASNNENGIGHLLALVPWLMMMMMIVSLGLLIYIDEKCPLFVPLKNKIPEQKTPSYLYEKTLSVRSNFLCGRPHGGNLSPSVCVHLNLTPFWHDKS